MPRAHTIGWRAATAAVVIAVALSASCGSGDSEPPDECGPGGECPAGLFCHRDNRCYPTPEVDGSVDAATLDAARPDAGPEDAGGASDTGPGAVDSGPICSGSSVCIRQVAGSAMTTTGGCTSATIAPCAPAGLVDCSCAPGETRLFFDPPPGTGSGLERVAVVGSGLDALTLQVDGICLGSTGASCAVTGACSGEDAYVWMVDPAIGTTPGSHPVRVYRDDVASLCEVGVDTVLFDVVFIP